MVTDRIRSLRNFNPNRLENIITFTTERPKLCKKGIGSGLLACAAWGLDGVLIGIVLSLAPFTDNMSLFAAPLVRACLHDGFSALWLSIHKVINGKWLDFAGASYTFIF